MNLLRCLALLSFCGLACAGEFQLAWSKHLPPRQPAHQWNYKFPKDSQYQLVEADGCLLVAIPAEDSLVCFDRVTGAERWRHFCEATIRQAPVLVGDAVLAGSEDGTVACLAVADGSLRWRYRPGPGDRIIIAHDRLADAWPIISPLAIADDAAFGVCGNFVEDGIWAFAIDLPSGKERWLRRLDVRSFSRPTVSNGQVTFPGALLAPNRVFDTRTGELIPDLPVAKGAALPAKPLVDPTKGTQDDKPTVAQRIPRIVWMQEGLSFPPRSPAIDLQMGLAYNTAITVKPPATWTLHGPLPVAERPETAERWGPSNPLAPSEDGLSGNAADGTEVLALGKFFMDEAGILLINASADRSMRILVDGQPIIDTLATGNGLPVSEVNAHTGTIRLVEGAHVLTVRCRAGVAGWRCRLAMGRCDYDSGVMAAAAAYPGHGFPGLIAAPPTAGSIEVMLPGPGGQLRPVARNRILSGVIQVAMDAQTVTALTSDGRIIGFTAQRPDSVHHVPPPSPPVPATIRSAQVVEPGWVLVAGLDDGRAIERLIDEHRWFRIVAVDTDRTRVESVRRRLSGAGRLDDGRTQIVAVERLDLVPAWMAELVVSERTDADWSILARCIKPYGGQLILPTGFPSERAQALATAAGDLKVVDRAGTEMITRPDGPAGSTGDWPARFGGPECAYGQAEPMLRFPLATRWFGGVSCGYRWYKGSEDHVSTANEDAEGIFVWWGPMLVARGRWLLQGNHQIGCFDQYTGHLIWSAPLPEYERSGEQQYKDWRIWWNTDFAKKGIRLCDLSFGLAGYEQACNDTTTFLAAGKELIGHDLATGAVRLRVSPPANIAGDVRWGKIQIPDQTNLVCTLFDPADNLVPSEGGDMPMRYLVGLDSTTGAFRWQAQPQRAFDWFAVGHGRVYVLDQVQPLYAKALANAGRAINNVLTADVVAFDLVSGKKLWSKPIPLCNTITYDAVRDQVMVSAKSMIPEAVQLGGQMGYFFSFIKREDPSGSPSSTASASATTADNGLTAPASANPASDTGVLLLLAGGDGSLIAQRQEFAYSKASLVGDRLLMTKGDFLSASDGAQLRRPHPLTGMPATMKVPKGNCTSLVMSTNFSASRQYWNDLVSGLSGHWSGDYSCKPNFIPAGGLINVDNSGAQRFVNRKGTTSRTLESTNRETAWATHAGAFKALEPGWILRLGVEPGAPGFRGDKAGGWWVPTDLQGRVQVPGMKLRAFRSQPQHNPSRRYETADHRVVPTHGQADIPAWVSGFGLEDPGILIIPTVFPDLPIGPAPRFRVRLIVSEPDEVAPGQRVFRVVCNGQTVVESLDVAAVAGGRQRSIVREWQADGAQGALNIVYERAPDSRLPPISGAILVERIAP